MTKLEEIARAMWNEDSLRASGRPRSIDWDDAGVSERGKWYGLAKSAVEAMRLPSEAMVKAGFGPALRSDTGNVWQAMIDAILNEKQAPQSREGTEGR